MSSRFWPWRGWNTAGAIDPVAAYRAAGYRAKVAAERPAVAGGSGGIV